MFIMTHSTLMGLPARMPQYRSRTGRPEMRLIEGRGDNPEIEFI